MKSEILHIDAIAYGGEGIARGADGKICFVPDTLPGETVNVRFTAEKKRFNRGELLEIITASPERIAPECPVYEQCPGCAYLHCSYEREIIYKQEQLAGFLVRKNLLSPSALLPPFPSPARFGCRNKLVMHGAGGRRGYIGKDNSTLLPVDSCRLAHPELNRLLSASHAAADRETFRYTAADGALNADDFQGEYLTETLPDAGEFRVAPAGFFQTNIPVAAEIVRRVTAEIAASELTELVELYCGVGIFSIAAAEKLPQLNSCGIEFDSAAVAAAKLNAGKHGVSGRCRFVSGDAGKMLRKNRPRKPHIMVVDPPRSGMNEFTLRAILDAAPEKIIYISCAPDTLTRDLEVLCRHGYAAKSAGLLDMFPGTAHFETMTVLEKTLSPIKGDI